MTILKLLSIILLLNFSVGCVRITETAKVLSGISTKALEERKDSAGQSRVFRGAYPTVYERVFSLLKKRNICVFLHSLKKHRMVAMYLLGEGDTTEMGIFFEEITPKETKVTITSLSPSHLKLLTRLVFSELEKSSIPTIKKEEGNEGT